MLILAEVDDRTVRVGRDRELGASFGSAAVADRGAGVRGELEMAGEEVGMEVSFQHVSDGEAMRLGVGEVLRNIALGVDHHGPASGGVTDEVAGVREAPEVVRLMLLVENGRGSRRFLCVNYTPGGIIPTRWIDAQPLEPRSMSLAMIAS